MPSLSPCCCVCACAANQRIILQSMAKDSVVLTDEWSYNNEVTHAQAIIDHCLYLALNFWQYFKQLFLSSRKAKCDKFLLRGEEMSKIHQKRPPLTSCLFVEYFPLMRWASPHKGRYMCCTR